jgi:hypothetical protein
MESTTARTSDDKWQNKQGTHMQMERAALGCLTALAFAVGCDRGHPQERAQPQQQPQQPAPQPVPARGSGACTLAPINLRRPMPKRLVAIGDVHGDLGGTRAALRAAGAIDSADRWVGGDLVVVQLGDALDRGDDEKAILDLFARLERDATAAGGAFIMLLGNHELMNAAGDYRYVTDGGRRVFGDRTAALGPGGSYATWLAQHPVVTIVGDTVFSHAGVLPDWVDHLDDVNQTSRCWLAGQGGPATSPPLALESDQSPVWTRAYGLDTADCAQAKAALAALGAKRMVVAHTVQPAGINAQCDDTVWRIDVGLAKLYGGPIQVLSLAPAVKVLAGAR